MDGEKVKSFGGAHDWTAWALPLTAGEHEISFRYEKEFSDDTVFFGGRKRIITCVSSDRYYDIVKKQGNQSQCLYCIKQ